MRLKAASLYETTKNVIAEALDTLVLFESRVKRSDDPTSVGSMARRARHKAATTLLIPDYSSLPLTVVALQSVWHFSLLLY